MKKNFQRLLVASLFALSAGVAGGAFASAGAAPLARCPSCNTQDLSCPGSPCECKFSWPSNYYCAPPTLRPE